MELMLNKDQFNYFRKKIFELAGISLSDVKIELLQSRLRSHLLKSGFTDFQTYQDHLSQIPSEHPEWESFINLLTTNKTDWFREPGHFDFLVTDFIPQWKKLDKTHLKVWCAASSTGEEPYTLSLVLNEAFANTKYTYEIHASDIDTKVLSEALNGVYPKERILQVPEKYRNSFASGTGDIAHWMKIKKSLKEKVKFFQYNLTQPLELDQKFDLIFCRNVLIYFNPNTISTVVNGLHEHANPESVLIIAHSESLQSIGSHWKFKKPSIYVKGKHFI
jgi:chemotaxis protein methyltransferase CheR